MHHTEILHSHIVNIFCIQVMDDLDKDHKYIYIQLKTTFTNATFSCAKNAVESQ